jgi:hypothetical protein
MFIQVSQGQLYNGNIFIQSMHYISYRLHAEIKNFS